MVQWLAGGTTEPGRSQGICVIASERRLVHCIDHQNVASSLRAPVSLSL